MIFVGFRYFYKLLENEESIHKVSRDTNTLRASFEMRLKY